MDLDVRAHTLDRSDPLAGVRSRFLIEDDLTYLDGNSLGRPTKASVDAVRALAEKAWPQSLVMGWDNWIDSGQQAGETLAPLIGAQSHEVSLSDQTSINLYKLASAAMASGDRSAIVTDAGNFPSDLYILEGVAAAHGGEIRVAPEDATPDELDSRMDGSVALVALTHVAYRSGAMHDGAAMTAVAQKHGARMLWDLAHSAGAVPVALGEWGADLAVGCTYKYLNGGPGSPGFVFVREDLQPILEQPIAGWFGHRDQFGFNQEFDPDPTIRRFLTGTPSILASASALAGIELAAEVGITAIHAKAISLTSLFIDAIDAVGAGTHDVITPRDPDRRGSHVTVRHIEAERISIALRDRGVIVDHRAPDLVRFGFAPSYNTHHQAVHAAEAFHEVVISKDYERFGAGSRRVT